MNNAEATNIFDKALDEAFKQGKTIYEAVACAELQLESHRKAQAKRRWRINFGIGVGGVLLGVALFFAIWQFGPTLWQSVAGKPAISGATPGGETPTPGVAAQEISITVYSGREPLNTADFVMQEDHTLTVIARYTDGSYLPDGTEVSFRLVGEHANIGSFSNNPVTVQNREATTIFTPTLVGDYEIEVSVKLADGSDTLKTEKFPIKIVSAASPVLSIRAEIRDGTGAGVNFVEAGTPFLLKLYVTNNGDGAADNAVVTITLPDGVSSPEISGNQIRIEQINIPAKQTVERDVFLTVPYIQDAVEKTITITDYQIEYNGQIKQGEAITFVAHNPRPGNIIFDSEVLIITHKTTPITITAVDFNSTSPQPITYPVPLTFRVDPPEAGIIDPASIVTMNGGQAVIRFTPETITVMQATLIVESGDLTRELPLVFTPMVVSTGSGTAQNDFYHRLTDDQRSQIVILPGQSVESGADQGNPDLVDGRIVYRLAVGTPVSVLGESREINDNGEPKTFYRVAVRFWISDKATSTDQFPDGPNLPESYLRILQGIGAPGKDDSWLIVTPPDVPIAPSETIAMPGLRENATDVDDPDFVIVRVIDDDSSSDWVLIEVEGWLAEDVIGFPEG